MTLILVFTFHFTLPSKHDQKDIHNNLTVSPLIWSDSQESYADAGYDRRVAQEIFLNHHIVHIIDILTVEHGKQYTRCSDQTERLP